MEASTRVLILEHPLIRELCRNILNSRLYEITDSSSETQVFALLSSQQHFDVLIADAENPRFEEIAALCLARHTAIIGLTDYAANAVEKHFPKVKAWYIQKPFCLEDFFQALKQATHTIS